MTDAEFCAEVFRRAESVRKKRKKTAVRAAAISVPLVCAAAAAAMSLGLQSTSVDLYPVSEAESAQDKGSLYTARDEASENIYSTALGDVSGVSVTLKADGEEAVYAQLDEDEIRTVCGYIAELHFSESTAEEAEYSDYADYVVSVEFAGGEITDYGFYADGSTEVCFARDGSGKVMSCTLGEGSAEKLGEYVKSVTQ